MEKPIRYAYLNKLELEYEVTIRAEKPAETLLNLREQMVKLQHVLSSDTTVHSSPILVQSWLLNT